MVEFTALFVPGFFIFVGLVALHSARKAFLKSQTATDLETDKTVSGAANETTVRGPVTVEEPADLSSLPDQLNADNPALVAWRIQEKVRSGGRNRRRSRWRTKDGGIVVGSATLRQDWEDIALALEEFDTSTGDSSGGIDPFDQQHLYLGEPEQQFYLGKRDPVSKRLEQWGILGDDGLLSNFEVTLSIGRQTMTPDRLEATVIEDGESITASGILKEDKERQVLHGTADTPLTLAATDLNERAQDLRMDAYKKAAAGVVSVLLGVGVGIVEVL